jgi:hypothetical protein
MTKDQLIKGPSCLTAAADDEPVFLLRANDELAPALVRAWAHRYRELKGAEGAYTEARRAKYAEALDCAIDMEIWNQAAAKLPAAQRNLAVLHAALSQLPHDDQTQVSAIAQTMRNCLKADKEFGPMALALVATEQAAVE